MARGAFDQRKAETLMREAISEAQKGLGRTSPNPTVGALVVRGGRIIARGYHRRAGEPHAEIVALVAAGRRARGADLYTTLEPCNHYGRTGPCSEAVVAAGVRRVFCASADPNPLVNGKGVARIRRAGIVVHEGLLREEADALNRPFFKYLTSGLPWVSLKAAVSLDGQVAAADGSARWITSPAARAFAHRLRDQHDVILVGAGTVERDNPRLTVRPRETGRDPLRIVLDSGLRLSPRRQVFNQRSEAKTVVATLQSERGKKAREFLARGVDVWSVGSRARRVDLEQVLRRVAEEGLRSVLVEGGPRVHASFIGEGWADQLYLFIAPKLLGSGEFLWNRMASAKHVREARTARFVSMQRLGPDVLLEVLLSRAKSP